MQQFSNVNEAEFLRGYKIPDFSLFFWEDKLSTWEHIVRFTTQCKEAFNNRVLKSRLFASSLTGSAFKWYATLTPELGSLLASNGRILSC